MIDFLSLLTSRKIRVTIENIKNVNSEASP
jgi:hypothetical protein